MVSAGFYDEYQSDKEAKQQKLSLYKTQTADSQWTMDCRLGIKYGLSVKCGLKNVDYVGKNCANLF